MVSSPGQREQAQQLFPHPFAGDLGDALTIAANQTLCLWFDGEVKLGSQPYGS